MKNLENKLGQETSPYLLQHADNPVNWQAWNQNSLDRARYEDKPILLSIGYSTCHWCHVMARESFEDEDTAQLMNQHFINIKVDREERPDLDKIYQSAHSMLTGRPGGWPLTVFLRPDDLMPFFAGTYFPKEHKYNMPCFREIMTTIHDFYRSRKNDIEEQSKSLKSMWEQMDQGDKNTSAILNALPLDMARKQITSSYDTVYGGFSGAPKFPHPAILERSLRHWALGKQQQRNDDDILQTAIFTLKKMAMGGLFDHLGGGFFRYSTDESWTIPHFEKMLYDNAQLLPLYVYAYKITGVAFFESITRHTADWVIQEMQSPEGGYYSALDADTEGEEGKFYTWSADEVHSLLNEEHYPIFARAYGFDQSANFEGKWHLYKNVDLQDLAKQFELDEEKIAEILKHCRKSLINNQAQRTRPGCDDKILTSWNALMIRGMCIAGRLLDKTEYIDSAHQALLFINKTLWNDQRLLATCTDGQAHLNAYLDDYAFLLDALIEYLQCRWDNDMLHWADQIAQTLLAQFEDRDRGGFYFTSHDHEQLILRSKTFSDDAIPAGNGIAAFALQRLGLILGNTAYLDAAENCIKAGSTDLQHHALTSCSLLHALEENLNKPTIIIIRGNTDELKQWQAIYNEKFKPSALVFAIPADQTPLAPLDDKTPLNTTCAYICEGMQCLPPITDIEAFKTCLEQK